MGRSFLTWFNPGTGSGYGFAVSNIISIFAFFVILLCISGPTGMPSTTQAHLIWSAGLMACYAIGYLGLTRLIVLFVRKFAFAGMAFSLLLGVLLPVAGAGLPYLLDYWLHNYRFPQYGFLHIGNAAWSSAIASSDYTLNRLNTLRPFGFPIQFYVVPLASAGIYFANLFTMSKELGAKRQQAPQRVQKDDDELNPPPEQRVPKSPWDDDPPSGDDAISKSN